MLANESGELQRFNSALQQSMLWNESFKLYGQRSGTYELYGDDGVVGRYHDDYFFAECQVCGDTTKICPDAESARDEHFKHCSTQHGYVYPADKRLKVWDSKLQNLIRLAQKYELPLPELDDHENCIKQYIDLPDGTKIVGCGVHKGNETKIWMGQY